MSNRSKADRVTEVLHEVRRVQTDQDLFDELAAGRLGVNRTDLRVLDVLEQDGSLTASVLATASGLSRPALTAAVDRLVDIGYVRRSRSEDDRREVRIELTSELERRAEEIWGPMAVEAPSVFDSYTVAELELIAGFLSRVRSFSAEHRRRLTEE